MANVAFKTYVQALTNKTTPTGADSLVIVDSADSNNDKETTITGIYNYIKSLTDSLYAAALGADDNYVTDAEKVVISNTSGTNTGDNATNTQYSGLAASKQDTLVSGTNIKTINSTSLLGSGDIVISGSVSDGDKGDITVSGSGTVWNIDAATVGTTELSATGTPSASTFLRGDNTWATPAGSGDVSKVGTPVNNQVGVWTGDGTIEGDAALTFDTTTDTLATTNVTATTVTANLVGNVTGNVSGTSGSTTGNAATVTTNANLTGHVTSVGNTASLGSFTMAQLDTAVSDGNVVYQSQALGTPSSGTVTNLTGTASININGTVGATTPNTVTGTTITANTSLVSGVNATTLGKVKLFGSTSGDATVQPAAVAGTATVQTLPATTGTLVNRVTTANGVSATNSDGALTFSLGNISPGTVSGGLYNGQTISSTANFTGTVVVATSTQTPTVELGHATDTTISRVSAGVIAVEGATVPTLTSTSTFSTGVKTFLAGMFALRNVANTFNALFTNTNTADRTYTLKDASGTLAFTSDITGTNSNTNTGDQTITNSSDATSHTVTLSASGGSVQLIEGSGVTLTTGGTGSAGTVTIAATGGSGTVTATGGSLTSNAVVLGAGTTDTKVSTGLTTDGGSQLNLGVNATTIGKVKMFGNTSGDVTIQPTAAAGTATVQTLPATTGTLVNRVTTANGISASNTDGALSFTVGNITPGTVNGQTISSTASFTGSVAVATTLELGHATDTTISRASAGQIAVEGVNVIMNGGALGTPSSATLTNATGLPVAGITASTSTALGVGSIELGHASDTSITRVSAGVAAIEGVNILTTGTGLPLAGGTMTGNITLGENASIALDPAGSADGKYTGITVTGTAGATLAFGDLIYLSSVDSRWELADSDAASTADRMMGMCVLAAASDGSATTVLLQGIIRADAKFPALTIGSAVYVGETAGAIQVAIPTGADNVIRRVGYAMTADEIYFSPSMDSQITVA